MFSGLRISSIFSRVTRPSVVENPLETSKNKEEEDKIKRELSRILEAPEKGFDLGIIDFDSADGLCEKFKYIVNKNKEIFCRVLDQNSMIMFKNMNPLKKINQQDIESMVATFNALGTDKLDIKYFKTESAVFICKNLEKKEFHSDTTERILVRRTFADKDMGLPMKPFVCTRINKPTKRFRYHWTPTGAEKYVVFKSEGVIVASKKDFCSERAVRLNRAYSDKYPHSKSISTLFEEYIKNTFNENSLEDQQKRKDAYCYYFAIAETYTKLGSFHKYDEIAKKEILEGIKSFYTFERLMEASFYWIPTKNTRLNLLKNLTKFQNLFRTISELDDKYEEYDQRRIKNCGNSKAQIKNALDEIDKKKYKDKWYARKLLHKLWRGCFYYGPTKKQILKVIRESDQIYDKDKLLEKIDRMYETEFSEYRWKMMSQAPSEEKSMLNLDMGINEVIVSSSHAEQLGSIIRFKDIQSFGSSLCSNQKLFFPSEVFGCCEFDKSAGFQLFDILENMTSRLDSKEENYDDLFKFLMQNHKLALHSFIFILKHMSTNESFKNKFLSDDFLGALITKIMEEESLKIKDEADLYRYILLNMAQFINNNEGLLDQICNYIFKKTTSEKIKEKPIYRSSSDVTYFDIEFIKFLKNKLAVKVLKTYIS